MVSLLALPRTRDLSLSLKLDIKMASGYFMEPGQKVACPLRLASDCGRGPDVTVAASRRPSPF